MGLIGKLATSIFWSRLYHCSLGR